MEEGGEETRKMGDKKRKPGMSSNAETDEKWIEMELEVKR